MVRVNNIFAWKKLTLGILLLVLPIILTACSGKGASTSAGGSKEKIDSNLVVVGFSQVGAESDWRIANTKSMREAFVESKGYRMIFKDAQQKRENQIAAIREFIAQKVNYIVVAPISEDGWDSVLKEAKDAGIPVIIVDRMIKTADNNLYSCWVGSDFRKEGGTAAAWMEKNLGKDKDLVIAHLQGNIGSSAQIGRTDGLQEAVNRNVNWKVVVRDSGDFAEVKGKEVTERFLKQYNRIDVLYCENDNMAFGAMKAMDEAGRTYGRNGEIKIISFDATRKGLQAMLKGQINFNVECNPLHGPRVEKLIQQLRNGETPNKMIYVNELSFDIATITQDDVDKRTY